MPTPRHTHCVSRWARHYSWSQDFLDFGDFIKYGHSCTRHSSSGKRCCAWRNVPMILRSLSSPTLPFGATGFFLGTLPAARMHLEEAITRYTPDQRRALVFRMGQDPGVGCRVYAAFTLWLLGYPAQALTHIQEALGLAHELSHPFSLAYARCWAAFVSQVRRDVPAAYEQLHQAHSSAASFSMIVSATLVS